MMCMCPYCRHEEGRTKPPAIMMSYGAKPGMASVLIPDHTHWGNEGGLLARLSDGRGISGWDAQYQYLKVCLSTKCAPQDQLHGRVVRQLDTVSGMIECRLVGTWAATLVQHQAL